MGGIADGFDLDLFAGKRVLLTGDTGFKGSWLALWLHELGAEVTGLSLPCTPSNVLFPEVAPLIRHLDGDIRDLNTVLRVTRETRPDFVFHLAAQPLVRQSYIDPQSTFATNVLGSTNLLEAVRITDGIRALVYITSDKCYRNKEWIWGYRENDELGGRDPYEASKACAELVLRAYRDSFFVGRAAFGAASARAANVIGGGDRAVDRIVPDTIAALEAGRPVLLRNPRFVRAWQHVLDPLYGYLRLAAALVQDPLRFSGAWNFGPGGDALRSVEELAQAVLSAWGSGEISYQSTEDAPHEAGILHLSSEKARIELGWQALWPFERAAAESVAWYRAVNEGRSPVETACDQIHAYMTERTLGGAAAGLASARPAKITNRP
jgi:CDP-glucose 4,6-dehydratase